MGKITNAAVQGALGVRSTWMSNARKGAQLVRKYGRGGKCENAEVVAELDCETKEGAKGLFAFFEKKKLELD